MPVKCLAALCVPVIIRNLNSVTTLGDLPLDNPHVRRILFDVNSAAKLEEIEQSSPNLYGELSDYWQKLIMRDFPTLAKKRRYIPKYEHQWHLVYKKLKREHQREHERAKKELAEKFASIKADKAKHVATIVDAKDVKLLPKLPRSEWAPDADRSRRGGGGKELPSTLRFTGGSRTKMTSGSSVMKRVRREVKEIASQRGVLARPLSSVQATQRQIKRAPAAMVNEHRIAAQPNVLKTSIRPKGSDFYAQVKIPIPEKAPKLVDPSLGNYISDEEDEESDRSVGRSVVPVASTRRILYTHRTSPPPKRAPAGGGSSAASTSTATTSSAPKRSGLLSNAYRPPGTKKLIPQSEASKPTASPVNRDSNSSSRFPGTTPTRAKAASPQDSPPLRPVSPPKTSSSTFEPMIPIPRKRKQVDIFMKPAKRR